LLNKHPNFEDVASDYEALKKYEVFQVESNHVDDAFNIKLKSYINHRTHKPKMGIVDATSLVVMDEKNIKYIISFDGDFDNIPFIFPINSKEMIDSTILNKYRK
jgi:predicted nucleic acid-binding protein